MNSANRLALAVGALSALPVYAANPGTFNYGGLSVEALSAKSLVVEDVMPGLSVVTGYPFGSPIKTSWVATSGDTVIGSVGVWDVPCRSLAPGKPVTTERRQSGEAQVIVDGGTRLLQLDTACVVSYGPTPIQTEVLGRLLTLTPDQALPHQNKVGGVERALAKLQGWSSSPVRQAPVPTWGALAAGQRVLSPEDAAARAGFAEAKVTPRQAQLGTGYFLRCGSEAVLGKTAVLVLSLANTVNQFSVYLDDAPASLLLGRLKAAQGLPGRELTTPGQSRYQWFSGDFVTVLEQQPAGQGWLFQWKNNGCSTRSC